VADANRLQGQELACFSDYISMIALSHPNSLGGCIKPSTSVSTSNASIPLPGR